VLLVSTVRYRAHDRAYAAWPGALPVRGARESSPGPAPDQVESPAS